jgi:pyridoxal phosphate enzyme (YggS family)
VTEAELSDKLSARIEAVEARIRAACARARRKREEVQLLTVTKTIPDQILPLLPGLNLKVLGENRPQELWRKSALLGDQVKVHWHLIGHLQRNKVERTLPLVELIHSVDSLRLLQALESAAAQRKQQVRILLEVNTSGEQTKQGFAPEEVLGLVLQLKECHFVCVAGLMTMAPLEADPQDCRPCFALLRRLRDQLSPSLQGQHNLTHLSMGMSNDFEVGIEEGATIVRIGSALFEGLMPQTG